MSQRRFKVAVLPGDGIGPEITTAARQVLDAAVSPHQVGIDWQEAMLGGCAIDACGDPYPPETQAICRAADAILLGAVGGPKWDDPQAQVRPEQGLLGIRKDLGLYANLRPVRPYPGLIDASPLRPERLLGVDLMFVRELTGGIYFGQKTRSDDRATDECAYTVAEIERVVRRAATLARGRSGRLCSVDKANVLETSRLWRSVVTRVITEEFPEVQLQHVLVDAMAMYLLSCPADFDVIVTENMFGDILTDEASMLPGSLGMLPSASLGDSGPGLFEPIHGSAPNIAGQGIANPLATILSGALLLRHGLDLPAAADTIELAVESVIQDGLRTPDLGGYADTATATEQVLTRLR